MYDLTSNDWLIFQSTNETKSILSDGNENPKYADCGHEKNHKMLGCHWKPWNLSLCCLCFPVLYSDIWIALILNERNLILSWEEFEFQDLRFLKSFSFSFPNNMWNINWSFDPKWLAGYQINHISSPCSSWHAKHTLLSLKTIKFITFFFN